MITCPPIYIIIPDSFNFRKGRFSLQKERERVRENELGTKRTN